jgi:hypothetical protein
MADTPNIHAVAVFASLTAKASVALNCSYEEAAVFLVKLAPLVTLLQDADFQDKLRRYAQAFNAQPQDAPTSESKAPQGKGIH